MGCGPSQAAEDQTRVPAPKKGWDEGFKVKPIKQTSRHKAFCHAWRGGDWSGLELGPQGPRSPPGGWAQGGRDGSSCAGLCFTAVVSRAPLL